MLEDTLLEKDRSESRWPFASGSFHLAPCFRGAPTLQQASALHPFPGWGDTPLCGSTRFISPFIRWRTFGLSPPLALVNNAAVGTHVRVFAVVPVSSLHPCLVPLSSSPFFPNQKSSAPGLCVCLGGKSVQGTILSRAASAACVLLSKPFSSFIAWAAYLVINPILSSGS